MEQLRRTAWNRLAGEWSDGEWSVRPLTDHRALLEEALAMEHCVDGYTEYRAQGWSRIFSIKRGGERTATLETALGHGEKGAWEVIQVRGRRNDYAQEDAKRLAEAAFRRYNEAWGRAPADERRRSWEMERETGPSGPGPEEPGEDLVEVEKFLGHRLRDQGLLGKILRNL